MLTNLTVGIISQYTYQIITVYTLNVYNDIRQLYLGEAKRKDHPPPLPAPPLPVHSTAPTHCRDMRLPLQPRAGPRCISELLPA